MMQRFSSVAVVLLAAIPIAGLAQSPAPMMSTMAPAPMGAPEMHAPMAPAMHPTMSPDMMVLIEHARAGARVKAYAAMSSSHRSQVAAIVAQFDGGKIAEKTAVTKIDAVLTYNEARAILTAAMMGMEQVHGSHMHGPAGHGAPSPGGHMGRCHCDMMGGAPGSAPMAMASGMPGMASAMPMAPGMMSPAPMTPGMMSPMPMHSGMPGMMHDHDRMMMHEERTVMFAGPPDAGKVMLLIAASQARAMAMMQSMHDMHDMHGMHGMPGMDGMSGMHPMHGQAPMPTPTP